MAEIEGDVELLQGKHREDLGQLEGRAGKPAFMPMAAGATDSRLKVEWLVRGEPSAPVTVTVRHDRAGEVRIELRLETD